MLIQTASVLWLVAALGTPKAAEAQPYRAAKARKHFISVSFEKQYVQPYGFRQHPLTELLGQPVDEVHLENFQYRTRDQLTTREHPEFLRLRRELFDFIKVAEGRH